jgi:hypothetical protein
VALCAEPQLRRVPYYERFGEAREMTRLEVEASAELPWVGGWLIPVGGEAVAAGASDSSCDLHVRGGQVQLRCTGSFELTVSWDLGATAEGGAVQLCDLPGARTK